MVCQSLTALRESILTVLRHAAHHTWGHLFSPAGSFLEVMDIRGQFHSLLFLPPCLLSIHAFKGPFTVPRSFLNAITCGLPHGPPFPCGQNRNLLVGTYYVPGTITWQGQQLTIRPPMLTYLGHVLAHPSHEDHTWDMVTNQLCHGLAAYKTLPLNGFEKVAIINAVLIPR